MDVKDFGPHLSSSMKRKNSDVDNSNNRKKMKNNLAGKSPLMQLNELKPGLKYVVESQEGAPHDPTFVVSVEVEQQKFIGKAHSKQLAKQAVAQIVLQAIGESIASSNSSKAENNLNCPDISNIKIENNGSDVSLPVKNNSKSLDPELLTSVNDITKKNTVMLLNQLHPALHYELVGENSDVSGQRFRMRVTINGKSFEGSGGNKKLAKAAAARSALCDIYKLNLSLPTSPHISSEMPPDIPTIPQSAADNIAGAVHAKFIEVMVDNQEQAKWKVLAGIVMTKDVEMKDITVVGVSTGTKCVNGEHLSMNGACLNDCHAEIIARRCFKSFIYSQLEMALDNTTLKDSIFYKAEGGGFCLMPNIKFHLFISTSPCGDARIFSPHEEAIDKHPNRRARGMLRTKIESGEGTIPVKEGNIVQTWDGIIQGQQRLLTMSCSDKIASWNVVGLQGALLSRFILPIYLDSIILGSLLSPIHMVRAMWGRFENISGELPIPFKVNKPKLGSTSSLEGRHLVKSPNFSINWIHGQQTKVEIINAITGKTEGGQISQIAKTSLFYKFLHLCTLLPGLKDTGITKKLYSEVKAEALDYQSVKTIFEQSFREKKLGSWVKKPVEQNEFEIILE